MWPAWLRDLEIELTLNSIANFIAYTTANSNISAVSVSNIEYVTKVLELPPQSYSQLLAANQLSSQNQIIIKSQSFTYGSSSLAASQGAGILDIPFTTRVGSLKGILWSQTFHFFALATSSATSSAS
jgi:hypothetical protein